MPKFKFNYDEAEHSSRKLNLKTLTANEFYDGFVAVVVGWDESDEADIEKWPARLDTKSRLGSEPASFSMTA